MAVYKKVGGRQRQDTARAMGFPERLWDAEPENWPGILKEERRLGEAGDAPPAPVAVLLEDLFSYARHPITGSAFTEYSVAELSDGQLDEDEVRRMRIGEIPDPPESKLLALSEVFGVDHSYWRNPARRSMLDPQPPSSCLASAGCAPCTRNYSISRRPTGTV